MRTGRLLGAASLAILLAFSTSVSAAKKKEAKAKVPAIVLPIDFMAVKGVLAGEPVPDPEMTAAARKELEYSYKLAFARIGAFAPMPLPSLTEQESAALAESLSSLRAHVAAYASYSLQREKGWAKDVSPGYSIGNGLSFLAERAGAEALVYMYGEKYVESGAQAPLNILSTLSNNFSQPVFRNTRLGVAVVELRTGKVEWMNRVEDISANVTTRGGANAYMLSAFGDYPKGRLGELGHPTAVPSAEKYDVWSKDFTVTIPAGWARDRQPFLGKVLVLYRHGSYIDSIVVDHGSMSGKPTDLIDLGRATIEQLKAEPGYGSLEIDRIEPATVADLPGFVVDAHYTLDLPDNSRLPFRRRSYGVVYENGYFTMSIDAVSPIYFDEGLPAFESLVASIKLEKVVVQYKWKKRKN